MPKRTTSSAKTPRKVPTLATTRGKLYVFISWSEARSRAVAEALHRWLPSALQNVVPFFSPEMNRGADWIRVLREQLELSSAGIICLTPENLSREWLLFEAGAISKFVDRSLACPLLFDLKRGEVKPPFGSMQQTDSADGEDVFKLVKTLNAALGPYGAQPEPLRATFDGVWPRLEADLSKIGPNPQQDLEVEIPLGDMVMECLRAIQRVEATVARLSGSIPSSVQAAQLRGFDLLDALGAPTQTDSVLGMRGQVRKNREAVDQMREHFNTVLKGLR